MSQNVVKCSSFKKGPNPLKCLYCRHCKYYCTVNNIYLQGIITFFPYLFCGFYFPIETTKKISKTRKIFQSGMVERERERENSKLWGCPYKAVRTLATSSSPMCRFTMHTFFGKT